jgi:chromosome partitioning protein
MAHVIAIANTKGGVGKSTLAVNLAVEAATVGHNTILVDADPQGSSVQFASVREDDLPRFEIAHVVKATLHRHMKRLSAPYHVVLIDVGGRDGPVLRSAIAAADTVLMPVIPSAFDAWSAENIFAIVAEIMGAHPKLSAYAVPNMITRTAIAREALSVLRTRLEEYEGIELLRVGIYSRAAWPEAVGEGVSVVEWQPNGKAAAELRLLSYLVGIRP